MQAFYALQYSNLRLFREILNKYKALTEHVQMGKIESPTLPTILAHLAFKIKARHLLVFSFPFLPRSRPADTSPSRSTSATAWFCTGSCSSSSAATSACR